RLLDAALPAVQVPVHRAEGDATGVALLDAGDARGEVAAEAVAHDGDALEIHLRVALLQVVERRGARHLVVRAAGDAVHAQALPLPRAVDREDVHAAARELETGEDDVHLLAVVHAIEDDERRRLAARALGGQPAGAQRALFIGHVDAADLRIAPLEAGAPAAQGLAVDGHLLLAGLHEALGLVV